MKKRRHHPMEYSLHKMQKLEGYTRRKHNFINEGRNWLFQNFTVVTNDIFIPLREELIQTDWPELHTPNCCHISLEVVKLFSVDHFYGKSSPFPCSWIISKQVVCPWIELNKVTEQILTHILFAFDEVGYSLWQLVPKGISLEDAVKDHKSFWIMLKAHLAQPICPLGRPQAGEKCILCSWHHSPATDIQRHLAAEPGG